MSLTKLDPLLQLPKLREELMKLPKGYCFSEQEIVDFLSERRWPLNERRIDRTTFWRWRNDTKIQRRKVFSKDDLLKLCQICDHYRINGTRNEYLELIQKH